MTDSADAPASRRPRKRLHYGEGREALLNAAVRVVARGGLRRLTYRAVAQEAGVTHGLVVHHGEVADFSIGLSEMVTADPDTQAFQYELLLESRRRPELLPQIRELYDEYFDAARRELGRMLPAGADKALARLVFAALDGLVLHQLVFDEPEVTEEAVEELRALLRLLHADGDAFGGHGTEETGGHGTHEAGDPGA
jgi:DNA-binding transcriptional regulator YbjK